MFEIPVELTRESQAVLQATMDPRIWAQLTKYYMYVNDDLKRIKPHFLKRFAC
jgi:hypothetical protein